MIRPDLFASAILLMTIGFTWSNKDALNLGFKVILFGVCVFDLIALVRP